MLFVILACAGSATAAQKAVISIKIVKAEAGRCAAPPKLQVLDNPDQWKQIEKETFQGENDWEAYWTLEAAQLPKDLPRVKISCPGVKAARAIVGRTDVKFDATDGGVAFRLVPDQARGQLIQTVLDDPEGDLPIDLHHNWEMRKEREYKQCPWPAKPIAAHNNYLFAAREALKIMGGFSPKREQNPFDGGIVLEGHETAATRGHMDFPPHFHIMLYPPGYTPGANVPHFYMDEEGRVIRNSFGVLGVPNSAREFGSGEWCSMKDLHGVLGLELQITPDGGLRLRKGPGQEEFLLAGDPPSKASEAVCVWRGDEMLCRCAVKDDAAKGDMQIAIERFAGGRPVKTLKEALAYDPFTGKIIKRMREQ
ncbi:MAG: hypothetical protein AB1696_06110 [Planctomycetota bacterium]